MQKKKLEKPILADGEATGHAHRLLSDVAVYEREDGLREFELGTDTDLSHEEHDTITLPPGEYLSGQVREWDSFAEEARRVQD